VSFLKSKKEKSPREQAREISEGKKEPHHIGKHSIETLSQEIFSLDNTKPMFREKKWKEKFQEIKKIIKGKISKNQKSDQCQNMLKALERIENTR
jgi:hypothetical protein